MSKKKEQITRKLETKGMAWAVTAAKTLLPEDEWGSKPAYHIHPDAAYPHQADIKRFGSLAEIDGWLDDK